jgi:hypothetical protein
MVSVQANKPLGWTGHQHYPAHAIQFLPAIKGQHFISREPIQMPPIVINSREYECWHEAGHAVVCLIFGGKVELMEIIKDQEHFGRARARCETTDDSRQYISCGGFASEYLLYQSGMLNICERDFVRNALVNAFPDKIKFFGRDHTQENNCWPSKMDKQFMAFSVSNVAPKLKERFGLLEELARTLLEKEYLNEEQIIAIAEKHND